MSFAASRLVWNVTDVLALQYPQRMDELCSI